MNVSEYHPVKSTIAYSPLLNFGVMVCNEVEGGKKIEDGLFEPMSAKMIAILQKYLKNEIKSYDGKGPRPTPCVKSFKYSIMDSMGKFSPVFKEMAFMQGVFDYANAKKKSLESQVKESGFIDY